MSAELKRDLSKLEEWIAGASDIFQESRIDACNDEFCGVLNVILLRLATLKERHQA